MLKSIFEMFFEHMQFLKEIPKNNSIFDGSIFCLYIFNKCNDFYINIAYTFLKSQFIEKSREITNKRSKCN